MKFDPSYALQFWQYRMTPFQQRNQDANGMFAGYSMRAVADVQAWRSYLPRTASTR